MPTTPTTPLPPDAHESPAPPAAAPPSPQTLYDEFYYRSDGFGGGIYERSPQSLQYYGAIAKQIKQNIGPTTVLDAGCAIGLLVETLRDHGMQAYGVDVSEYAIKHVYPPVSAFCRLGSFFEPLPADWPPHFDLVTCLEIVEHLPAAEADAAIARLCELADDIVFSSTPNDYAEATHFNVQPVEFWVERFAVHGFARDLEFDGSSIAAWAMRFRRVDDSFPRQIRHYEQVLQRAVRETVALRQTAIAQRERLAHNEAILSELRSAAESETGAIVPSVTGSQAWRLATKILKLRQALAPTGSTRARLLRWLTPHRPKDRTPRGGTE